MRLLLVLAGLAVLVVGFLMALVLMDQEDEPISPEVVAPSQPDRTSRPGKPPRKSKQNRSIKRPEPVKAPDMDEEEVNEKTVMKFGQEFEKKWHADKERLGVDRHKAMEKLWFRGRRPRGAEESIKALETILKEYPDTNRAGCAALELGHHYLKSKSLDSRERLKKAEQYWRMVGERYSGALCEYNANPLARSKLALATWIYRGEDPAQARRLLEEIIEKHKGETDHLGQPLEVTAKRLLKQLK